MAAASIYAVVLTTAVVMSASLLERGGVVSINNRAPYMCAAVHVVLKQVSDPLSCCGSAGLITPTCFD